MTESTYQGDAEFGAAAAPDEPHRVAAEQRAAVVDEERAPADTDEERTPTLGVESAASDDGEPLD
jgi:hypothetical protein